MILDGLLQFHSPAGGDVPTVSAVSGNSIDLGLSGLPLSAGGGGARDIGIGDDPAMKILVLVAVGFAGGTSLQVSMQGAPDNGSGVAGAFVTMASGPVVALAQLIIGARLFDSDMPRPAPGQALPRFLQLAYTIVGTMSGGGAIKSYLVLDRHDLPEQANATLGGYPVGITIAN